MTGLADVPAPRGSRPRSDRQLVNACVSGDADAWSELIDRYKRLIFTIALRQGLSREDAADVFQAVCLDLVTDLPNVREPTALPAWLIRTTARKASRWKRRNDRYLHGDERGAAGLESEMLPDSLIEHVQRAQALREGIAALPERCRTMVRMLFFENPPRPYREVAEALGVASGSIGFLRSRCLDRLRALVDKAGV